MPRVASRNVAWLRHDGCRLDKIRFAHEMTKRHMSIQQSAGNEGVELLIHSLAFTTILPLPFLL